jgi:selT/selW/selH-like putative selenoprotein
MPNATGLVARLLEEHEDDVAAIEVVPGDNGIFDVHVDGALVFTKSMLGRYPDPDDVIPLVRAQLADH